MAGTCKGYDPLSLHAGMNMLVCTPGRLLQHMDETPGFDASQIQALVLDEADRILDMGFSATLNAILQNLPQKRQAMLFSATQTKSVKDLARLSLKAPEYIAVHAEAAMPTPVKLQQVSPSYSTAHVSHALLSMQACLHVKGLQTLCVVASVLCSLCQDSTNLLQLVLQA